MTQPTDRELLKEVRRAWVKGCDEGGVIQHLCGPMSRVSAALAQPEPQGAKPAPNYDRVPLIATEAQIRAAAQYLVKKQHCDGDLIPAIRYAVARWGRPIIEPVPVSERLPGPEDCDEEGRCWIWTTAGAMWRWQLVQLRYVGNGSDGAYTHWLPHHALPLPLRQILMAPEVEA